MGIKLFSDSPNLNPNPNPHRFKIMEMHQFGKYGNAYTVCRVHYPDCTTHLGQKVLVYKCPKDELYFRKELDPHFLDGSSEGTSPIARFPGNYEGWTDAIEFATMKTHVRR